MASDYGRNFGFRRSDESMRIAEGRIKTPKTGPTLLLGTAVEIDPANPGYLRVAAAGAVPRPGICGLLLQEESWRRSIFEGERVDSFSLAFAKKNTLSVITNGAGVKVWFKNTTGSTRADGRVIPPVTMVAGLATLAIGTRLGWDGTAWAAVAPTADVRTQFMEVTFLDVARNFVEAVLLV